LYLLFVPWHFPLQNDNSIQWASIKAENLFRENYSAVYNHLSKYKEQLSLRNTAETWIRYERYALQRRWAKYWDNFSRPKIIYGQFRKWSYAFDETWAFLSSNEYMITSETENLKYLLWVVNSKINLFYQWTVSNNLWWATSIFQKDAFEWFPIPKNKNYESITNIVDTILKWWETPELNKKLNQIVYGIYELTNDEIEFIEYNIKDELGN